MEIRIEPWGTAPDGRELRLFSASSPAGVSAAWTDWGASLVSLKVPARNREPEEMLLTYSDSASLIRQGRFFGAVVGRWANRIASGRFPLDGQTVELSVNNPPHHLHGGRNSWCQRVWSAEPFSGTDRAGVVFSLLDPAGSEGYPGNLWAEAEYWLSAEGEAGWNFRGRCDSPTILNMVNHAYWNLAGPGSERVLDHGLKLHSRAYFPKDQTSLPLGPPCPVEGSIYDFQQEKNLGQDLEATGSGYDHCYILENSPAGDPVLAAVLRDPSSLRSMEVWTTSPCLQLYTGNFLQGDLGAEGRIHRRYSGVCLETQLMPDAPNRAVLPPGHPSPVLRPGEYRSFQTVHRFSW